MTTDRKKFGEILVANGIISRMTLQRALEKAQKEKKKIGVMLEDMGVATGEEIAAALAEQFKCKLIKNFADFSYSPELLQIIPLDTVTRNCLFPLKLDKNNLYLAMADPTDTKIVSNFAKNKELSIVPIIASRGDITAAINKHYLGKVSNSDKRQSVLLVEDNAVVAAALESVLVKGGYRVILAKDGMEAFKKAISELPDVILTDKEMPVFDGYQLLEALKPLPETMRIPVILFTSSLNSTEESEAFEKGFYDFIAKPIKDVTLITRVKRALQGCEGTR